MHSQDNSEYLPKFRVGSTDRFVFQLFSSEGFPDPRIENTYCHSGLLSAPTFYICYSYYSELSTSLHY